MNEEAIQRFYELFQQDGYTKSLDEFKQLMRTNEEAQEVAYELALGDGYTKYFDDFKLLVGATMDDRQREEARIYNERLEMQAAEQKKKEDMESLLEPSSSESRTDDSLRVSYPMETTWEGAEATVDPAAPLQATTENMKQFAQIREQMKVENRIKAAQKQYPELFEDFELSYRNYDTGDAKKDLVRDQRNLLLIEMPPEELKRLSDLHKQQKSIYKQIPNVKYPEATKEYKKWRQISNEISEINNKYLVRYSPLGDVDKFEQGRLSNLTQGKEQLEYLQSRARDRAERKEAKRDRWKESVDKYITEDLAGQEEEEVVSFLKNQFGDSGFSFQQVDTDLGLFEVDMGDAMRVVAPNGADIEIDLDTVMSEGEEAEKLKNFMMANRPATVSNTIQKRYNNEQDVKEGMDYVKSLNNSYVKSSRNLDKFQELYYNQRRQWEALSTDQKNTPEGNALFNEMMNSQEGYNTAKKNVELDKKKLAKESQEVDYLAGKYLAYKNDPDRGSYAGALYNSALGLVDHTAGATVSISNLIADKVVKPMIKKNLPGLTKEELEGIDNNEYSKELLEKARGVTDAIKAKDQEAFAEEWKKSTPGMVLTSVAEFLPAMAAGPLSIPLIGLSSMDMFAQEMESIEAFDNVDDGEKLALAAALAIPMALLERIGFTNAAIKSSPKILNYLMAKGVMGAEKAGMKMSHKAITKATIEEIENSGLRGLAKMGAAGLAEFETGLAQGMVEGGTKWAYDFLKDKKMYDAPDLTTAKGWGDWAINSLESGYYEMLGGLVMGVPVGLASAVTKKDFTQIDDASWELFKQIKDDPTLLNLSEQDFIQKIALGKASKADAIRVRDNFREAVNIYNKIPEPDTYSTNQQKQIMGLLLRKAQLEARKKGKDPTLALKEDAEIDSINKKLAALSESAGDAAIDERRMKENIKEEFSNLKEDDEIELVVEKLEDIPEQYREKATKQQTGDAKIEVNSLVAGLPIGKTSSSVSGDFYTYKLTGKQINDAIQEQSTTDMDAPQSTTDVQEVEVGTSAAGPEVTATEEIKVTDEEKAGLNNLGFTDEMIEVMTPEDVDIAKTYTDPAQATEMKQKYEEDMQRLKELQAEGTEGGRVEAVTAVEGDAVVNNRGQVTLTKNQEKLVKRAKNVAKSLKGLIPKLKIVTHATNADYFEAINEKETDKNRFERGEFDSKTNTIHINLQNADGSTVFHEGVHALLYSKFSNSVLQKVISDDLIAKLVRVIPKGSFTIQRRLLLPNGESAFETVDMHQYLKDVASDYKKANVKEISEEQLAEVFGALASQYNSMTVSQKSVITKFFAKVYKFFGGKGDINSFTNDDVAVVNLLNSLAFKMRTGEEIIEDDVTVLKDAEQRAIEGTAETTTEKSPKTKTKGRPKQTVEELLKERSELEEYLMMHPKKRYIAKKERIKINKRLQAIDNLLLKRDKEDRQKTKTKGKLMKEGKSHIFVKKYPDSKTGFKLTIKEVLPNNLIRFEKNKNINNTNNLFRKDNEGNYVEVLPGNKTGQVIGFKPAKTKAAPVETTTEAVEEGVNAEIELEIAQVEFEIEEAEQLIEEIQIEINNIKSNFKEDVDKLKARGKKFMKTDEYAEELEELKYSRDGNLESYNDDLKEARSDKRKLETKKKKLEAKLTPTSRKQVAAKEVDMVFDIEANKNVLDKVGSKKDYVEYLKSTLTFPQIFVHNTLRPFEEFDSDLTTTGTKDLGKGLYVSDIKNSNQWKAYQSLEGRKGNTILKENITSLASQVGLTEEYLKSLYTKNFQEKKKQIQNKLRKENPNLSEQQLKNETAMLLMEDAAMSYDKIGIIENALKENDAKIKGDTKQLSRLKELLSKYKKVKDVEILDEPTQQYYGYIGEQAPVQVDDMYRDEGETDATFVMKGEEDNVSEAIFKDKKDYIRLGSKEDVKRFKEFMSTPTSRKQIAAKEDIIFDGKKISKEDLGKRYKEIRSDNYLIPIKQIGNYITYNGDNSQIKEVVDIINERVSPKKKTGNYSERFINSLQRFAFDSGTPRKFASAIRKSFDPNFTSATQKENIRYGKFKNFQDRLDYFEITKTYTPTLTTQQVDNDYNKKVEAFAKEYGYKIPESYNYDKKAPTSRKQVAAKESVAPMKVNEEFSKMTPAQKRKQIGGRFGNLSLELRKGLFRAKQAYKYADEYERLRKSNKIRDIELFEKKYQQNPPMTEQKIFLNSGGWYRGVDGEYRYEIPDGKLVKGTYQEFTKQSLSEPENREARLDEIYIAPELYKTYPQIADIMVQFEPMVTVKKRGKVEKNTATVGYFSNRNQLIVINTNESDFAEANPTQQRNLIFYTLLHEIQHAIQLIEGFALGASDKESKAGRGKRVTEKWNQGKEDLTKERIFQSRYHKDLRKKYETFRINKEFVGHFIRVLNKLSAKRYNEEFFKLLKSGNKGKDLVSILKTLYLEGGEKIYKELAADARYFHKEVSGRKIKMTQESLGNFLDKMLDFSALNGMTEATDIEDVSRRLIKMLELYDSFNMYSRTYGEIESRNVEERARKKKELAVLKSKIDKVERLGMKKGVDELEKIERIEQLEEQLYRELPTVHEDSQGLIEGVNEELQGPYIMKTQPRGRMKKVAPKKQTQLTTTEENVQDIERIQSISRKQLPPKTASLEDIVAWGRERGEKDSVIRMLLKSRGFGTLSEIDDAMRKTMEMKAMPTELASILGGIKKGEELFKDVMTKFYDATMETKEVTGESKERIAKAKKIMLNNPQEYGNEKDGVFIKKDKEGNVIRKQTLDITKAKGGVKIITATEVLGVPRTSMETVFTKSLGKRREILQDLLKKNPVYKNLSEYEKATVESALDRVLNTRANPTVQQRIEAARRVKRAVEKNQKDVQELRNRLTALIRESLPKVMKNAESTKNLNRLLRIISKGTKDTVLTDTEKILKEIETINKKEATTIKDKIRKIIKAKSRSDYQKIGVDATTHQFFQALNRMLKIVEVNAKDVDLLEKTLRTERDAIDDAGIDYVIRKINKNEKLTPEETNLYYRNEAYEMLKDFNALNLDEVQGLFEEISLLKKEGIEQLKSNLAARTKRNQKTEEEAIKQIKEDYSYLVNEDGTIFSSTEVSNNQADIFKRWRESKGFKSIKDMFSQWAKGRKGNMVINNMGSLETMTNALDNPVKGNNFFTENFTNRLKDLRERFLDGKQKETKKIDEILNSISGIKSKTRPFKRPYGVLIDMLAQPKITVTNAKGKTEKLTRDQALRIYALWQNPVQRQKLEFGHEKGEPTKGTFYNQETINEIESKLGKDLIEFADKVIAYLNTEYYDSINQVYRQVNNANLKRVENYFPTRTVNDSFERMKLEEAGDFGAIFQAVAPALHERTDTTGRIKITEDGVALGFTSVLSEHIESMERFKAYAEGVKTMRDILRMKSVNSVLEATRTKQMIKDRIMAAVNPSFLLRRKGKQTFSKVFSNFTSWALGFKLWQVPKQASSFITSFADYDSGIKSYDALGVSKAAGDMIMYSIDLLTTVANLSTDLLPDKQRLAISKKLGINIPEGPIHQAYRVSATFRDRIQEGMQGDVWGLESGSAIKKRTGGVVPKKLVRLQRGYKDLKTLGNAFTMFGDALGVMGYMVNYRRDLKRGMSQAEALRKFNKYESTQQTRSTVEKNRLQLEGSDFTRVFTMFASTIFLQQNQIAQSSSNILQAFANGKIPRQKDIRALYLNLGIANVAFIFMQQIFKYAFGDDEEVEEVTNKMEDVMYGINSLAELPLMGPSIIEAKKYFIDEKIRGKKRKYGEKVPEISNPLNQLVLKGIREYDKAGSKEAIKGLAEVIIGINTDPIIGFKNKVIGDSDFTEMDKDFYDMLGIPKTARPKKKKADDSLDKFDNFESFDKSDKFKTFKQEQKEKDKEDENW